MTTEIHTGEGRVGVVVSGGAVQIQITNDEAYDDAYLDLSPSEVDDLIVILTEARKQL